MTFMRMPMFMWAMLVTTILILLAFPCLTVGLLFLFLDRFVGTHFYLVELGATPILWQHLFWLFGHPEVYIMALPAFGMMSEILPVFSRKPLFGYAGMAYSMVLIGFLSYGVWGHHMFATGMGPVADSTFAITTMLIAIPTGIKIFSWCATVWGGSLRMKAAFYFGIAAVLEFTLGGLSGVMHASVPIDLQQTDTYFVVAHFHYVLFGGMMFAILGGFYYWWPKITGRMMNEERRQAAILADHRRLQRHFLPDALSWRMGDAAAHLHLRAGNGMGFLERASKPAAPTCCSSLLRFSATTLSGACFSARRRMADPVGCPHAGVGDFVAAAALQF